MGSKYYKHFNPNPRGLEIGDCVIRALCAVTDKSWYDIFDIICKHARDNAIMPNESLRKFVEQRMSLFGLRLVKLAKPNKGEKCYTVSRFCKEHNKGKYILNVANHEIAIVDGHYYDIYPCWDNSRVYSYYEFKS